MGIIFKCGIKAVVALLAMAAFVSCETTNGPGRTIDPEPLNEITPLGVGNHEIRFDVYTTDQQSEYIVACVELDVLTDAAIESSEQLVTYHNNYYAALAATEGVTLEEYLTTEGLLLVGNKKAVTIEALYPDTSYVVCCYGVEFTPEGDFVHTTAVAYEEFRTTAPNLATLKFDLVARVDGDSVVMDITPEGYDGMYYCYFVAEGEPLYLAKEAVVDDNYCAELRRAMCDLFMNYASEGLLSGDYAYNGETLLRETLSPNANYMAICFSIDSAHVPTISSVPSLCHFRTLATEQRMVIDIDVSALTPYNANLTLTPSKDTPYACVFLSWEQYSFANEDDDMMIMETILTGYMPAIFTDVHSEMLTPLMPNTEYIVVAFGTDRQIPTSALYTHRFTTPEAVLGANSITGFEIHKVFDVGEIIAIDSSYSYLTSQCECVVVAEVYTTEPTDKVYWWWYDAFMHEEYTDEAFLEDLLMYGYTPTLTLYGLWYDVEFIFAGIVEDEQGNLSNIYYGDIFVPTHGDCSPAEEFFDYVNSEVMSTSCVILRK